MTNKQKGHLNPDACTLHKKTYGLKQLNHSDCPVWSSIFKLQVKMGPAKLKGLSIKSKSQPQDETHQKPSMSESPVSSDSNFSLKKAAKFQTAAENSFLNAGNQTDGNSYHGLPGVSDRWQIADENGCSGSTLQTVQLAKEKNVHLGFKSTAKSHPPAIQRKFIELQLSSSSGVLSPVMKFNGTLISKDTKDCKNARLASVFSQHCLIWRLQSLLCST